MSKSALCMFLFVLPALAQHNETVLPPQLISADLPNYPAIAKAAHITGWLKIQIKLEKGSIISTKVLNTEARDDKSHVFKQGLPFLTEPTLTNLKSWRFDPDANGAF